MRDRRQCVLLVEDQTSGAGEQWEGRRRGMVRRWRRRIKKRLPVNVERDKLDREDDGGR